MTTENTSSESEKSTKPRFRRRKFLVDRRNQLIPTLKVAGLVLVLLLLLNLFVALLGSLENRTIVASAPQLRDTLHQTEVKSMIILGVASLLFLATVVIRSIMLTHRTAGAAYKLNQSLTKVTAGQYDTTLKLRLKDNLRDLERPFDEMTRSLRRRAQRDAEDLARIADEVDALGESETTRELSARVRGLADAKRKLGG